MVLINLPVVDAIATVICLYGQRTCLFIVHVNQVLYNPHYEESLLTPKQLQWYGQYVDLCAIVHGGEQIIRGEDFKFPHLLNK